MKLIKKSILLLALAGGTFLSGGQERWIDSSSTRVRAAYKEWWDRRQAAMSDSFKKCRVDSVSIRTEDDYVKALIALFDKRN